MVFFVISEILLKTTQLLLLLCSVSITAQSGFFLKNDKKRDRIPFQLVNNLPIVEVEINGTTLFFILDTGVKSTILFSLEEADSVQLKNTSPVMLQGLGSGGKVEALKSLNNKLKVGDAIDLNHSLYTIFDSALNFSPRMGIPIHGILGSDFFENFVVKINYASEVITIYNPRKYQFKSCRKCEELTINFVGDKPYVSLKTVSENSQREVTLLIDSGSSDVLWLFDEADFITEAPKNYFHDFLGLGLSGDVFGKRARIPELVLGKYRLKDVNTSFPEENAILKTRVYRDRDGTIGGGFLSRFTVIFDYENNLVRFKKNRKFKDPFHYNMSGLTLEHGGVEVVKEERSTAIKAKGYDQNESLTRNSISILTEIHLSLVPKYIVVDVRKDSPAELAGIKVNDEVISINGKPAYKYKLFQLIDLFSNEEGKTIVMHIKRNGQIIKVKFELKSAF